MYFSVSLSYRRSTQFLSKLNPPSFHIDQREGGGGGAQLFINKLRGGQQFEVHLRSGTVVMVNWMQ